MFNYSDRSESNLKTCHEDIQVVFRSVIQFYDHSVLCGFRGKEKQNQAHADGMSLLTFPLSDHNVFPSLAVDAVPYPLDWDDHEEFALLIGRVLQVADMLSINLKSGIRWRRLKDRPHFYLAGKKYHEFTYI